MTAEVIPFWPIDCWVIIELGDDSLLINGEGREEGKALTKGVIHYSQLGYYIQLQLGN